MEIILGAENEKLPAIPFFPDAIHLCKKEPKLEHYLPIELGYCLFEEIISSISEGYLPFAFIKKTALVFDVIFFLISSEDMQSVFGSTSIT